MKTVFAVACNWDPALIEELRPFAGHIKYIYGKTRTDVFSGGRAASQVKELAERKKAEEYIRKAGDAGLEFNYLLNGTELKNEFSRETTKRIRADLDWIANAGAKWVTVSNPRIAEIIRDYYPSLKISVSVFAHVRTPRQVKRWEKRGAKSICLDRHLVRNKKQLELLVQASDMEYMLLVNDPCLLNCEKELYHDRLMSRASVSKEKYFHFCSFECLRDFINDPTEILRSTYIRPEDIKVYEDLGIHCFKIVDRNRTTKFIVNAVKAYVERKYEGNLLDLMSLFSCFDRKPTENRLLKEKELSEKTVDLFWRDLPSMLRLHIDNSEVGRHSEHTRAIDCETECRGCKLCSRYKGLVKFDKKAAKTAKKNIELIIKKLNSEGL